jgi:hypothetical protein
LRIVLGDNKKNKSDTLSNHIKSIKYTLVLKNSISKKDTSKINFSAPFPPAFYASNVSGQLILRRLFVLVPLLGYEGVRGGLI